MISTQATCVRLGRASWGLRLIGRARNPRAWDVMEIKILWPITRSLTNTLFFSDKDLSFWKCRWELLLLRMSYQNVWSTLEQQLKKTENVGWTTTRAAKVQWALTPLEGTPPLISFWCTRRDPFSLKVPVDLKNGFDDTCACSASVGWRLSWSLVGR